MDLAQFIVHHDGEILQIGRPSTQRFAQFIVHHDDSILTDWSTIYPWIWRNSSSTTMVKFYKLVDHLLRDLRNSSSTTVVRLCTICSTIYSCIGAIHRPPRSTTMIPF